MILVVIDAKAGKFARYDGRKRTHSAEAGQTMHFTREFIENIRVNPPQQFSDTEQPEWLIKDGNEVSV
jgi:hypothetical protein